MHTPPQDVKILIVDDNPDNLLALEAALGKSDYKIVLARSGMDALGQAESDDFAVVLLDVQMPVMDGFEVARRLRHTKRTSLTPIIFLTAQFPNEENVLQGYEAGAVDYLIKPINLGVLRAKVAVFADLFRKNDENRRQAVWIAEIERREAARKTQLSERRYQRIVEGIRDGIVWVADVEMKRFSFVSHYAKRITGFPAAEWVDVEGFWEAHLHPSDRDRVLAALAKTRSTGEGFVLEHRFLKASGEPVWFHTGVTLESALRDGTRELFGLSFDITHLKNTERALLDAIQGRDEFLSIASHELRTPITPLQLQMQGFCHFMETGRLDQISPERLRQMIEMSVTQVTRLTRLVSQLLDVSRINSGRFCLEYHEANFSDLVREVLVQFDLELRSAECLLKTDLDDGISFAMDRPRLEQVLVNLLTNALKYGSGRPIEVRLWREGGTARLAVRDEGIGISPVDHRRIFDRFERAVSPQHYGGLGLGLYICAQIISLHRGRIWVDSELGKGATFNVELPIAAADLGFASVDSIQQ